MKTLLTAAALFAAAVAVGPSMGDLATAVASQSRQTMLAEAESSGPSRFGKDSAQLAEAESSGATRFGHDTAMG